MYAIGITSSDIRPPFINSNERPFEMASDNRNDLILRQYKMSAKYVPRYAACLYRARQTNEGHWIWEKTGYVAESRTTKGRAIKDAYIMRYKFGTCRVIPEGLGFKRITT